MNSDFDKSSFWYLMIYKVILFTIQHQKGLNFTIRFENKQTNYLIFVVALVPLPSMPCHYAINVDRRNGKKLQAGARLSSKCASLLDKLD